jgi:hypothetical protein
MKRRPLLRLFLRNQIARERRSGDPQRAELLSSVLQSEDLLEAVSAAVEDEFDQEAKSNGAFGGNFLDFVNWLYENREAILKLVLLLVSLFATKDGE